MAGRGPAPKDPSALRRRNAPPTLTVVASDDVVRGPELPDDVDWPDATLAWWETWRRSPQATTFTETDWSFLLDTAILHMDFWDGKRSAGAELRLRVAKFGATPEDRARLRLAIGESPKKPGDQGRERKPAARTRRRAEIKAVVDES